LLASKQFYYYVSVSISIHECKSTRRTTPSHIPCNSSVHALCLQQLKLSGGGFKEFSIFVRAYDRRCRNQQTKPPQASIKVRNTPKVSNTVAEEVFKHAAAGESAKGRLSNALYAVDKANTMINAGINIARIR